MAKYLPCKFPSIACIWDIYSTCIFQSDRIIFKLTSEDLRSGKGPKWALIDDSMPNEVSEFIIFGTDSWFEMAHWFGRSKIICSGFSWFKGRLPAIFICWDTFSSPNPLLYWESWTGCSIPGKHIGCKLIPFLIDSIWNVNQHVSNSQTNLGSSLSLSFNFVFFYNIFIERMNKRSWNSKLIFNK